MRSSEVLSTTFMTIFGNFGASQHLVTPDGKEAWLFNLESHTSMYGTCLDDATFHFCLNYSFNSSQQQRHKAKPQTSDSLQDQDTWHSVI